ncbi:hypothetical protein BAMBUS_00860 [Brevundimonas phage vB_BpoS-Bambus]|nr:hypothetical protein BAMBUS_00860 [Brevundimonas phage vB_BpoS-Bambus]
MTDESIHPAATRLIRAVFYGLVAEGLREADEASTQLLDAVRDLQLLGDTDLKIAVNRALFRASDHITDLEWGARTMSTLREVGAATIVHRG